MITNRRSMRRPFPYHGDINPSLEASTQCTCGERICSVRNWQSIENGYEDVVSVSMITIVGHKHVCAVGERARAKGFAIEAAGTS